MLSVYRRQDDHLVPAEMQVTAQSVSADAAGALWIDLINPSRSEDQFIERLLGVSIPTKEEAQEIEVSARLYHEDGAEFMTMTGVSQLESEAPMTTPITFVLKGETLVTIRYAEPKPFFTYAVRAQKSGAVPCVNSEQVMLVLAGHGLARGGRESAIDLQLGYELVQCNIRESAMAVPPVDSTTQCIIE